MFDKSVERFFQVDVINIESDSEDDNERDGPGDELSIAAVDVEMNNMDK